MHKQIGDFLLMADGRTYASKQVRNEQIVNAVARLEKTGVRPDYIAISEEVNMSVTKHFRKLVRELVESGCLARLDEVKPNGAVKHTFFINWDGLKSCDERVYAQIKKVYGGQIGLYGWNQ